MYLQLDTKFNPFTYDEMVKPLLYYKQAYDEAEAAYSDLATQTEAWKDIVNRENSPEAFEMYQRYSGDLSRAVDDFSQGMTAKNRRALLGLKRRYAQDITPIARASEAMNAANELRAKAGPDAIFEVGEYNSLDQFLHGKTANNKYQSREALTKKTAAMTEAAMAEALKDPDFEKYMGDQFWLITQHTGGSYEDLKEAMKLGMMDNPIAQNRFSQIRQEVAKNAGIQNYDAAGQQAIMDAIDTGLYAGLDKPVRNFQANADHITPAQRHSMAMQNAQLALSAASSGMEWDKNQKKWVYSSLKDPAVIRVTSKPGDKPGNKTKEQEMAYKFPIISKPYFYDIKNPHKSGYLSDEAIGEGTPITYSNLEDKKYEKWNKLVQKKTGNEGATLKNEVDALIKSHYPSASPNDIIWIANTYYSIQVDDNANITLVPKKVSSMQPSGSGSGVDPNKTPA